MTRWLKETGLVMGQSLKMLLSGKYSILLLLGSLVLLVVMLGSMNEVKEEKSRISIGIADESNSEMSRSVINGMKEKDLYDIICAEEEELLELLKAGDLSAVCVFKKAFAESIARGRTNRLVTIYEAKDGGALLLGDILAGVMMQEICTAKSYQTLLDYERKTGRENSLSGEDYRTYVNEVLAEGETEFSFDISYVTREQRETKKPSQEIIYEQAIYAVFALMAGLISIYAVLPFRRMRHGKLAERMKMLPVHASAAYAGSAMAGMLLPMIFGMCFLGVLFWKKETDLSQILSLLVCTGTYICGIVCIMLVAAYVIRNHTVYQMGMLAMILVFGILGLVSLAEGLLLPNGTAGWVPNGWFVRKMTELYHQ